MGVTLEDTQHLWPHGSHLLFYKTLRANAEIKIVL